MTVRNMANIDCPSFIAHHFNVSGFSFVVDVNQFCTFFAHCNRQTCSPSLRNFSNNNSFSWFELIREELYKTKRERHRAERKRTNNKLPIFKDLYRRKKSTFQSFVSLLMSIYTEMFLCHLPEKNCTKYLMHSQADILV